MLKKRYTVPGIALALCIYFLFYGYKNNYHWLLHPEGAIMAATDVSTAVANKSGKKRLWPGVSPELGFLLLEYVDLSKKPDFPATTWLNFSLNSYDRSLEKEDPERAKRIFRVAQFLIDSGLSVNERSSSGFTPLEGAVLASNYNVYMFLINNGADTEIRMVYEKREGASLLSFAKEVRAKTTHLDKIKDLDRIVEDLENRI